MVPAPASTTGTSTTGAMHKYSGSGWGHVTAMMKAKRGANQALNMTFKEAWKNASATERCLVAGLTMLKLYYLSLTQQVFSFFDCTEHLDGSRTLDADPSLICDGSWYDNWKPLLSASLVIYVFGIPFMFCLMLGVSPGAALVHLLLKAHDSLFMISEMFEVALVGYVGRDDDDDDDDDGNGTAGDAKPKGVAAHTALNSRVNTTTYANQAASSRVDTQPRVARRHSKCVIALLAALLVPYFVWGVVVVEPALFLYGLARILIVRPAAKLLPSVSRFAPQVDPRSIPKPSQVKHHHHIFYIRAVALARVGRTAVWLPIPGCDGDPALAPPVEYSASGAAGGSAGGAGTITVAASQPVAQEGPMRDLSGSTIAAGDESPPKANAASEPTAAPAPGSTAAAASAAQRLRGVRFRNSFENLGGVSAPRSMRNIAASEPTFVVNTSSRLDGKLPFVAACLGRDYRREFYYYELAILVRKVAILVPEVFFTTYPALQATFTVIVLLMALSLHSHVRPFRSDALNWLEFVSLALSSLILLAGLVFNAGEFPSQTTEDTVARLVIVAIAAAITYMCFALLWAAIMEVSSHYRDLDSVNRRRHERVSRPMPSKRLAGEAGEVARAAPPVVAMPHHHTSEAKAGAGGGAGAGAGGDAALTHPAPVLAFTSNKHLASPGTGRATGAAGATAAAGAPQQHTIPNRDPYAAAVPDSGASAANSGGAQQEGKADGGIIMVQSVNSELDGAFPTVPNAK